MLPSGFRGRVSALLAMAMEGIVLIMVCASPWAYGAVHEGFEFLLYVGLGLVLLLWGARILLAGTLTWKKCPVAACLGGLFLLGIWQLTPLPASVMDGVAPDTARLYGALLPQRAEVLSTGEEYAGEGPRPGSTLTLYPGATRQLLIAILAVFLLFAAVRNNIASTAPLRRLSVAVLFNGALLALFALVQLFSSEPGTLYWRYPAASGQVFGPFINRNHFACYMNLCIGMGVGFVLSRGARRARGQRRSSVRRHWLPSAAGELRWLASVRDLVNDPAALAACCALALMVSSVAFSLSRGGCLALLGGVAVFVGVMALRSPRRLRLGAALVTVAAAVALASWFGYGLIKARLATVWEGEAFADRLPLWARTVPMAGDFPLWGTGYGTYEHVEKMYRIDAEGSRFSYDHAHNEYLELLVEAGAVGLSLGLLAIGAVYWLGGRAIGRTPDPAARGLVAGALLAFSTLVLHSVGEFGAHVPAITVLAAVLCAHICAQGSAVGRPTGAGDGQATPARASPELRARLWGLAPCVGAVTCVALGLMIYAAGWKAHRLDRLRVATVRAAEEGGPDALRLQRAYLEAAVTLAPDNAELQAELGSVRLQEAARANDRLGPRSEAVMLVAITSWAAASAFPAAPQPAAAVALLCGLTPAARHGLATPAEQRRTRSLVALALKSILRARDACPSLSRVQLAIASHTSDLARADPQEEYLRRAQLLAPADPKVWYTSGLLDLAARRPERAWASWRRSLELSESYLPQILSATAAQLTPEELAEKVLSNRPELLLAAATRLEQAAPRIDPRPLLTRALGQLAAQSEALTPQDLRTRARVLRALGREAEAMAAYQTLVARQPEEVAYRHELARFLYDVGRLDEARREISVTLAQQPTYGPARELLRVILRDLPGAKR
jgi:O-antigen ligase/tetratricopeptide (TPR) repeat protein